MSEAQAIKLILEGTGVKPLNVAPSKYRNWTILGSKRSLNYPIRYEDGHVGGSFHATVTISQGDLLARVKGAEPAYDTWCVDAIRHWTKPKCLNLLFDNEEDAMRMFRKLCLEQNENIPPETNYYWGEK